MVDLWSDTTWLSLPHIVSQRKAYSLSFLFENNIGLMSYHSVSFGRYFNTDNVFYTKFNHNTGD